MRTSLKRIMTTDGIELVGLLYEPDKVSDKIVVHVHGMGGNFYENKFLDAIAHTLTENGIAFFAFNNRGCEAFKDLTKIADGKKSFVKIGDAYEIFEECVLDIAAAIDAASGLGFKEIHLSGHSLGSPKAAYYLAQTADARIRSVLFLSPADMLGLERNDQAQFDANIAEAQKLINSGKGKELLSKQVWDEYPISAATYLSLFADDSKAAIFNLYDSSDTLATLAKFRQPLIAIMGRKDDALTVSIEETMQRISKAAVNSTRVETIILGDANHGYFGSEQELADAILKWVVSIR